MSRPTASAQTLDTRPPAPGSRPRAHGPFTRALRQAVLARLDDLAWGEVTVVDGADQWTFGHQEVSRGQAVAPRVRIEVHDPEFYPAAALRGTVGVGESYGRGQWSCDDLVSLVRIFVRNRETLEGMEGGLARLGAPFLRFVHWLRPNSRSGAQKNIAAHYDLGNAFFERMLDPTMMYSSAFYPEASSDLHEAQVAKLERICAKLDLRSSDHLVEIGTGWGGMAEYAARTRGCRVTTTTISQAQFELATERVRRAGLEDRVTVCKRDYRDLEGSYDKLVSIEMVEAIGREQYPTYLRKIAELLKPDGLALIQAITIRDDLFGQAAREVDFIKRHIFPGCCIPSIDALTTAMAKASDLRLAHLEDLTPHYARTLADWRENFELHRTELLEAGYDEEFQRLWEWYLVYCEGGFLERAIHDVQLLLAKPLDRRAPLLPRALQRRCSTHEEARELRRLPGRLVGLRVRLRPRQLVDRPNPGRHRGRGARGPQRQPPRRAGPDALRRAPGIAARRLPDRQWPAALSRLRGARGGPAPALDAGPVDQHRADPRLGPGLDAPPLPARSPLRLLRGPDHLFRRNHLRRPDVRPRHLRKLGRPGPDLDRGDGRPASGDRAVPAAEQGAGRRGRGPGHPVRGGLKGGPSGAAAAVGPAGVGPEQEGEAPRQTYRKAWQFRLSGGVGVGSAWTGRLTRGPSRGPPPP
ncbi:MAG: cyclopropane-fatty-acyl-phospholipid synthase family protein [Planctomycetota bacterium]